MAFVVALALVLAACGRDDETTPADDDGDTTTTAAPSDAPGAFGDLGELCGPAPDDATLADTDTGVTAESIQISTFSDPGFAGRPGLNQELFDTAEAFAAWCNDAGGINGRTIDLKLRDAALVEYKNRVIEACDEGDFMMVGGGAVFDDTGQEDRLACGLPTIAGYVVTAVASEADLTYQPVPNPVEQLPVGDLRWIEEQFPESVDNVGIFTGSLETTVTVARRYQEGIEQLGWNVVYNEQYNPAGEPTWRPMAEAMRAAGVEGLVYVGEPVNQAALLKAMADIGYEPQWVRSDANHYDSLLITEGGAAVNNVFVRGVFHPFLDETLAAENPATQQFLDIMGEYAPDGKIANLGIQGFSSWLLFAAAAKECGADLTRDCVWEELGGFTDWTGGGLHAPQDVGGKNAGECFVLYEGTPDGFVLPDIDATDGVYACSGDTKLELTGDYGEGATCPNPAYADDPKPSNCAA
ncbi:MAG TPA: ABC transporter substrate-binding protein [Acidimicrobiia bacterium]|nr:ABC transporter substrate-binding protein [Acidimicrobiia bacterium]